MVIPMLYYVIMLIISCCSNFWVDTICYTDLVLNLTIFYHLRIDKNDQ